MKALVGWVANGFSIPTGMKFTDFMREWPNSYPAYRLGKLVWVEGSRGDINASWTEWTWEDTPDDGEQSMFEQIALAQYGTPKVLQGE